MATYTKQLTCHATATAATVDTITMTGVDVVTAASGAANPPYATAIGSTTKGPVQGFMIYNATTGDLWYSYGPTGSTLAVPTDTNPPDGVRRLPAGQMLTWPLITESIDVKVYSTNGGAYTIEVWQ